MYVQRDQQHKIIPQTYHYHLKGKTDEYIRYGQLNTDKPTKIFIQGIGRKIFLQLKLDGQAIIEFMKAIIDFIQAIIEFVKAI